VMKTGIQNNMNFEIGNIDVKKVYRNVRWYVTFFWGGFLFSYSFLGIMF
jgi:hypothetical protein